MELPRPDPGQNTSDHEARITKVEVRVQDLSVELKLLRQAVEQGFAAQNERINALPGQILALVRAEMAEKLTAQNESLNGKLAAWRKENAQKLDEWRKENDHKLEEWRKENDLKLAEWRKENDHKLEDWRKENDHKLEDWRKENDQKLDVWRKEMLMWFRLIAGIILAAVVAAYFA